MSLLKRPDHDELISYYNLQKSSIEKKCGVDRVAFLTDFFSGSTLWDLIHVQEEAIRWCREIAGMGSMEPSKRLVIPFDEEEKTCLPPLAEEQGPSNGLLPKSLR